MGDFFSNLGKSSLSRDLLVPEMYYADDVLTHYVDMSFLVGAVKELSVRHATEWNGVQTVVTPAVSGVAFASLLAAEMRCDLIIARKSFGVATRGRLATSDVRSYTGEVDVSIGVSSRQLSRAGNVLLADDFMSTGSALLGVVNLLRRSQIVGAAVIFDKAQLGGSRSLGLEGIVTHSWRTLPTHTSWSDL